MPKPHACKDCKTDPRMDGKNPRKTFILKNGQPAPGKRCGEHHRAVRNATRTRAHAARVEKTYGITGDQYWALYAHQGGRCAICRRATGATRKLCVDHDHKTGKVRMLACRPCNTFLGHLRDDPDAGLRIHDALRNPPAQQLFGDDVPRIEITDEP